MNANPHPVLDQINIITEDFGASLAFYRRLGLPIPDTAVIANPQGVGVGLMSPAVDAFRSAPPRF